MFSHALLEAKCYAHVYLRGTEHNISSYKYVDDIYYKSKKIVFACDISTSTLFINSNGRSNARIVLREIQHAVQYGMLAYIYPGSSYPKNLDVWS